MQGNGESKYEYSFYGSNTQKYIDKYINCRDVPSDFISVYSFALFKYDYIIYYLCMRIICVHTLCVCVERI